MDRRDFGKGAASAAFLSLAVRTLNAQSSLNASGASTEHAIGPQKAMSPKLKVAMLLYPGLTLLDLVGPQTALALASDIQLVWKDTRPITSDTGTVVTPQKTFSECHDDLDVLFVPGGPGTVSAMKDKEVLTFLSDQAARTKFITSVCTGSIVLGAAGLLDGYKATCHWAFKDKLSLFGAIPTDGRVVVDRNRITGGGVTAGIDFGLVILAHLRGDPTAKISQLAMEYDPQPPFQAGSPQKAGPELTGMMLGFLAADRRDVQAAAAGYRKRMS